MNKEMLEKVKNNVGRDCIITGHPYIQDGTQGNIKDIIAEMEQYLVIVGSDILYIPMAMVEIVQPKWEDIESYFTVTSNGNTSYFEYFIKETGECEVYLNDKFLMRLNFTQDTINEITNNTINNKMIEKYIQAKYLMSHTRIKEVNKIVCTDSINIDNNVNNINNISNNTNKSKQVPTKPELPIHEHYDFVDELLKMFTGGKPNGELSNR